MTGERSFPWRGAASSPTRRAKVAATAALLAACAGSPAARAESRPVFPLPEGLYSDGETCGAAEIMRNRMYNGFSVRGVIGDTCEIESIERQGSLYRFRSSCSEGNGQAFHSWRVDGRLAVTGPASFTFDKTDYHLCSRDRGGGTADYKPHADQHLPLVGGSYRTPGGRCGALVYWDNPKADILGGTFGGPDFGGDVCSVKRVIRSGDRISFEATCIPDGNGRPMRIGVPSAIVSSSPERFSFAGKPYDLCKRIAY